ncbi:MAG: hypothetical protein ACLT8A_10890 [Subdoligranulum sp.]
MLDNVGFAVCHTSSGGQKPLALCDHRCPCFGSLFPPLAALTLRHPVLCLRFWLGICRTSLAVSALRIMRYCPRVYQKSRKYRLFLQIQYYNGRKFF